jgi:hypothetical protein
MVQEQISTATHSGPHTGRVQQRTVIRITSALYQCAIHVTVT